MTEWPEFKWRSLDPSAEEKLNLILERWRGTPYSEGAWAPSVGVNCVRFVCAIADHMFGRPRLPIAHVPADQALHAPVSARAAMRFLMRRYDARTVKDGCLEPGDVLATGPAGGGPGHAIIAGIRPTQMWQSTAPSVWPVAYGPQIGAEEFYGVLRVPKENW